MKRTFHSVSVQLAFRFTLLISLIIVLLAFLFTGVLHFSVRLEQKRELTESAGRIESVLLAGGNAEDLDFAGVPYYVSYIVYDGQTVLYTNDPFLPVLEKADEKLHRYTEKKYYADSDLDILYYAKKIPANGTILRIACAIDIEKDFVSGMFSHIPAGLAILIVPVIALSFFISFSISAKTMLPVVNMTAAAEAISHTNADTLLPVGPHRNELDRLAETFNRLFKSLQSDLERERTFTGNVSHELKTPVAIIDGHANLLKRWGKNDPVQLEKSIEAILHETASMNTIITRLLELAKWEKGTVRIEKTPVHIHALYLRLQEEFKAIYPALSIAIPHTADITVVTDGELLHQVLTILIANSITYAGESCTVTLGADKDPGRHLVRISVQDNGPGFAAEAVPHVFERFYRGDEARQRDKGGAGLGLSIAKAIMEALQGTISVSNMSGNATHGGAKIELVISE